MASTPSPGVCKHGHPWTPENTCVWADGFRRCKVCRRERGRRRYAAHADYWAEWYRTNRAKLLEAKRRRDSVRRNARDRDAISKLLAANPWLHDIPELQEVIGG